MTAGERMETRMLKMEAAVLGIDGEGGLIREFRGMRVEFKEWRREERERREAEATERLKRVEETLKARHLATRATVTAVASSCLVFLGVAVQLVLGLVH